MPADLATQYTTLFLCGDVMTGRGIDQILPHASNPILHEPFAVSALDYVEMAERVNGPIQKPVDFSYVWGEAAAELDLRVPHARILNLETSITTCEDFDPKGINYRMHPANVGCLTAIKADCCVLANNHVLDWGRAGLAETLAVLHAAKIQTAGAGPELAGAAQPAIIENGAAARVLVFSAGTTDSGIPHAWAATAQRPGIALVDLSSRAVGRIAGLVGAVKRPGDVVILSIHWGENWGYSVPQGHRNFAHEVLDHTGVDIIHGHSSHHPKGIEVYRDRLILFGCGDFLNDYEGIAGYEEYRSHLTLMYFVTVDRAGRLAGLEMKPLEIKSFRLQRAAERDARWLRDTLNRESEKLGTRVEAAGNIRLGR